jgi:uncharacterized protein with HEPN domain
MAKVIEAYFEDILFSIERIELHISKVSSFAEFKNDFTVYDAVERRIAIIGEALWQADKMDRDIPVTSKPKIIGLRHIITHDYDMVNPEIIWKILENNLPVLKEEVKKILEG